LADDVNDETPWQKIEWWKATFPVEQCFSTFFASRTTLCNKKIWGNSKQYFI